MKVKVKKEYLIDISKKHDIELYQFCRENKVTSKLLWILNAKNLHRKPNCNNNCDHCHAWQSVNLLTVDENCNPILSVRDAFEYALRKKEYKSLFNVWVWICTKEGHDFWGEINQRWQDYVRTKPE